MTPEEVYLLRSRLKLTQADFAKQVGVTRDAVKRWEMQDDSPSSRIPSGSAVKIMKVLERKLFRGAE